METISNFKPRERVVKVRYKKEIEEEIQKVEISLQEKNIKNLSSRWLALRLLENDEILTKEIEEYLDHESLEIEKIDIQKDEIVEAIVRKAEGIASSVICYDKEKKDTRKIDKILTNKITSIPIMLLMLMFIFYLTITFSNYPSEILFSWFSKLEECFLTFFENIHAPLWVSSLLIGGIYKTLSWVVAVMLPPMAIFFPLFTIL